MEAVAAGPIVQPAPRIAREVLGEKVRPIIHMVNAWDELLAEHILAFAFVVFKSSHNSVEIGNSPECCTQRLRQVDIDDDRAANPDAIAVSIERTMDQNVSSHRTETAAIAGFLAAAFNQ